MQASKKTVLKQVIQDFIINFNRSHIQELLVHSLGFI